MTLALTVDGLVERVRRDANLGVYGPLYSLSAAVDDTETLWALNEEVEHLTVGSVLAVDTELVRVKEIEHEQMQVTVVRGFWGTTAAAHSEDTLVEQDPRLPKASLVDWAQHEINSWHKQIFQVKTLALSVARNERTYPITPDGDVDFLLEVRQEPLQTSVSGTLDDYAATWSGDAWPRVAGRLLRDMPVSEFASGWGLQLEHFPRYTTDLRVAYASPFDTTTFDLATDLVTTVGLEHQHLDILEQGLRWRALSAGLASRTDWRASGMVRDAEEVNLLDIVRSVDMARSLRDRRFADEALALRSRYPYAVR